ncbi:MAG: hypothetical protein RMM10_08870 [Anaerolineae bacterium]|uniref:hypothetical protein n=1 Tax=Thermoflexus sp. TaxID=1969742 RepID=UPI0025DE370E|nr:hypothetical protein [Thermoflexus sp.]MCS7351616.1 hypothetical protein [Thermoflexus sp.]MDW8181074.1 hypothetical protein [Anaerolineae bacterium]
MKRWAWILGSLALVLWGCQTGDQAARPSPSPFPSPSPIIPTAVASPTRTPSTPTPSPVRPAASPTATKDPSRVSPGPIASSRPPAPLPDGFQTGADWMLIFRPALDQKTWMDGEIWLSNGQRWIGPWPSDVFGPFWTSLDGKLAFCYYRLDASLGLPTCETVPPHLRIQPDKRSGQTLSGGIPPSPDDPWFPCGENGALCLRQGDRILSGPFRLPLPKILLEGIRSGQSHSEAEAPMRLEMDGCVTDDRRRAVFALRRLGGTSEMDAGPESPLIFAGAVYWVDLESGRVLTAPANAPTWPDEQDVARRLAKQGVFPPSFLPFWERTLSEPTVEGLIGCSPSNQFALVAKMTSHRGEDVYFPSDVERFFQTPRLIIPNWSFVMVGWVIRLEDGSGYPLTLFHELFTQGHTIQWVKYKSLGDYEVGGLKYLPPTHPLPWWGSP